MDLLNTFFCNCGR